MVQDIAGEAVPHPQLCSLVDVHRVAAMLDISTGDLVPGAPLPLGWHFFLFGGATPRSALRTDGFPGLGVEMPDLGLPRLVLAGRKVEFLRALTIGDEVMRKSSIHEIAHKETKSGKIAILTVTHELWRRGAELLAREHHTYYLMPDGPRRPVNGAPPAFSPAVTRTITSDEILLFQYSALGFNSHRIHIDRSYARDVEGYPDLVVNGGLVSLLLTEFLQRELGVTPKSLTARHLVPLFCGRPITLAAARQDRMWRLAAIDDTGACAVDMEVDVA